MSEVIYGIHSIGEALKRGGRRFDYVAVSRDRTDNRLQSILDDCRAQGISVRFVPREDIDRETRTNTHQGVMAVTSRKEYTGVEELLEHKHGQYSFLLVLDGVEDPHNLGALLRSADGAGVDGVVIPERRAAGITGTVVKASAGAASTSASPAWSTSPAPSMISRRTTSGSSDSTSAAKRATTNSTTT